MNYGEITGTWDYRQLAPNIRVGKDCYLERRHSFERFRSTRDPGLIIGDRVSVYTWTTFNVEPGGLVEIGEDSVLVGAVLMCARNIRIGKRVVISYNVTIADSDFHPIDPGLRKLDAAANAPFGNRDLRPAIDVSEVWIQDDVWVGIGAILLKGLTIGTGARIGPGSVVTKDVPPFTTVAGNPAKVERQGALS